MTQNEQQEYLDQCEAAFLVFAERFPDFDQSESSTRLMAAGLREAGLSPTSSDHLAAVWLKIRPNVSAPVAPTPADEPTDPIEREALRMIADGEVTVASVRAMSSHELELRIRNLAFCRALELLPKPAPEPVLTRGDHVRRANIVERSNKNGLDYDPAFAVENSRQMTAQGYANPNAGPAPLPRGAARSVINLRRDMHIPKPLPSLQTCLTQEQKDAKWMEEQRTKSARAQRVRANRSR